MTDAAAIAVFSGVVSATALVSETGWAFTNRTRCVRDLAASNNRDKKQKCPADMPHALIVLDSSQQAFLPPCARDESGHDAFISNDVRPQDGLPSLPGNSGFRPRSGALSRGAFSSNHS